MKQKNVMGVHFFVNVEIVRISHFVMSRIRNQWLMQLIYGFDEKKYKLSKQTDRSNFLSVCFLVGCYLRYIQLTLFPFNCTVTSVFSVNFACSKIY